VLAKILGFAFLAFALLGAFGLLSSEFRRTRQGRDVMLGTAACAIAAVVLLGRAFGLL
jgi:hypothetical protein